MAYINEFIASVFLLDYFYIIRLRNVLIYKIRNAIVRRKELIEYKAMKRTFFGS